MNNVNPLQLFTVIQLALRLKNAYVSKLIV
jgi:hypothetical protein